MPKTSRASYTRGLQSDSARKYIDGKANKRYRSVPDFLKAGENKECKDVAESTFRQWVKKEREGEYVTNMNSKKFRASTFPKMEGNFVKFIRAREKLYAKDKVGLNWTYMK